MDTSDPARARRYRRRQRWRASLGPAPAPMEIEVLVVVRRLGAGRAYGDAIVQELIRATGKVRKQPQVATLLKRIVERGYVTKQAKNLPTGRPAQFYQVTPAGEAVLDPDVIARFARERTARRREWTRKQQAKRRRQAHGEDERTQDVGLDTTEDTGEIESR